MKARSCLTLFQQITLAYFFVTSNRIMLKIENSEILQILIFS